MVVDPVTQERLASQFSWSDIELRSYQLEGVNWMLTRYHDNHGCILGDEMGLGKTCQTIALLSVTAGRSDQRGHLVICPRSVLENWAKEFERFSPSLKVKVYIGDKEHRADLASDIKKSKNQPNFDVLLTTYEMCLKDHLFLQSMRWNVLVVDEAHRLKNHESLLYTTLEQWDVHMKVLLTGTPVQNNLRELYALLSFVDAKTFRLSRLERFVEKYSNEKQDVKELLERMEPYLLRRTKNQVLIDLPDKKDIVLYHGLSALQKKLYKAILTKDIGVFQTSTGTNQTRLMNILMQLRKCVNHPYLFDGVEEEPFELGDHLVEASSKLCLIDQLLTSLHAAGHKVLMFSQMSRMLDVLQDYLGYRGYTYERLDGSVRGEERFLAVQNFNQNEDTFVFLLSTKAGGQGLNLTSADTVMFVDSDFNPQNDLQAAARAHRIGQDRPVKIIRLIGRHTVEEIILRRAEEKLRLTEKVIESGHFATSSKNKRVLGGETSSQMQEILKFGVDELLSESSKSDETLDFEGILGRSEEGRWVVEDRGEGDGGGGGGATKKTKEQEGSMEVDDDVDDTQPESQSMYVFEGTDYSKEPTAADIKAFEQLIKVEEEALASAVPGEKTLRRAGTSVTALFSTAGAKPRKQLTAEQVEERRIKMKEAAERKVKLAEERKKQRIEKQKQKKEKLWKENDYTSKNVTLASDGEEEKDEDNDDDDNDDDRLLSGSDSEAEDDDSGGDRTRNKKFGTQTQHRRKLPINYALGDVTKPKETQGYENIVVHCVDDSGSWGRGGVFSVLSSCSRDVEDGYQMAGNMDDLSLGDCHLIHVTDGRRSDDHSFWVALLVAQHRDRNNRLSGIDLTALQQGLHRLHVAARDKHASVHLPRIGHDTPKFNWYATERLIRKHLAAKGVPTFIYYFPRKGGGMKRKQGAMTITPTPVKVARKDDGSSSNSTSQHSNIVTASSSSSSSSSSSTPQSTTTTTTTPAPNNNRKKTDLSCLFSGVSVYFHGVSQDRKKKLTRFLLAYDGDVHKEGKDTTTHVLVEETSPGTQDQALRRVLEATSGKAEASVVLTKWVEACISKGVCLPCKDYLVSV